MAEYIFDSQEEVDRWYDQTVDGLGKAINSGPPINFDAGRLTRLLQATETQLQGLHAIRCQIYERLGIEEKPTEITLRHLRFSHIGPYMDEKERAQSSEQR
jgi:hypothetical protein